MMTYIGSKESESARKQRSGGGGERFLPHIKVFTWLRVCLLSGREGKQSSRRGPENIRMGKKMRLQEGRS